jgi:hypothetical protein
VKRLVRSGELVPLAHGLFAHPKRGRFGIVPPGDEEMLRAFLDNTPFVLTGPDRWNALGLGTTAVFAEPLVYNKKRSGRFVLGGRAFQLRRVAFPETPTPEWYAVDLLDHADQAGAARSDIVNALARALAVGRLDRDRVTPAILRDLTSFVHAHLAGIGQLAEVDLNLPTSVRCVHPLVTLLEKLDALHRRALNPTVEPATFVRHFEDAARVIAAEKDLPALTDYVDIRALATDMLGQKQLASLPNRSDPAFAPDDGDRWNAIRRAHGAIAPMFWGTGTPIEEACKAIRGWIGE